MSEAGGTGGARAGKILALEALRGVLAIVVVVFHFCYLGPLTGRVENAVPAGDWLSFGNFAVASFFVISGYVISLSARGRSAAGFAVSRLSRLWPAMAICATITFLGFHYALGVDRTAAYLRSVFLLPLAWPGSMIDASYWSIVLELRFYAIVLVLMLAGAFSRLLEVITLLGVAEFAVYLVVGGPFFLILPLFPYAGYFGLGIALYALQTGWKSRGQALALLAVNAQLAVLGTHVYFADIDGLSQTNISLAGASVVVAVAFGLVALATRLRLPAAARPVAVALGALSYPLYLVHQEIGYFTINGLQGALPVGAATVLAGLIVAGIAAFVYRFVEKPGTKAMRPALQNVLNTARAAKGRLHPEAGPYYETVAAEVPDETPECVGVEQHGRT